MAHYVIDVAALIVDVNHAADGELVVDRNINHSLDIIAHLTFAGEGSAEVDARVIAARIGLIGNQAYRTCLRTCPEERALRTR